ncbi:hypothetical protein [Chondromyces apiculatus]|uniref:Tetratricopeptide repeat protein n=1 Tax=Chondromyces apiculatus DSM 436 TaxID=1192034 RepID=A0A017SUR3_9BACT|nr:hypothetical protein [Chondromyces apiculatus]EYF00728.1 Hypothetical protein CAP_0296 [Chondromyces apiculatus DSM 436]
MNHDVLQEAVRALREQTGETPATPDATRARILASLRNQRARRLTLIKTVLPLAAVVVGSLAWAGPSRLPALWNAMTSLLDDVAPATPPSTPPASSDAPAAGQGSNTHGAQDTDHAPNTEPPAQAPAASPPEARIDTPDEAPSAATTASPSAARVDTPDEAPSAVPVAALPVAAPPAARSATSAVRMSAAGTSAASTSAAGMSAAGTSALRDATRQPPAASDVPPRPEAPASATSTASSPAAPAATPVTAPEGASAAAPRTPQPDPVSKEHALYKEAHRLHFVARNASAALAAWDAYLRADPRGRFATEARYNRALCLVRLGRATEARSALDPFARGAFGGYRQAEAQALLDAMDRAATPAP